MISNKVISFFLAGSICLSVVPCCAQTPIRWYSFDRDFVTSAYNSDSAIGKISVLKFRPAGNVHSIQCGGDDGELHIGINIADINVPNNQSPPTSPISTDNSWGIVAELPNAQLGNGPALLKILINKPASFDGYFRVWDEGHSVGPVHPSNPHHVFEVHPAWGFSGTNVVFSQPEKVNSITGYSGYGATKFKPLITSLVSGVWPRAFQKDGELFVGLIKAENFYQLPIKITGRSSVTGGHEFTMDLFSDQNFSNRIYSGLTGITTAGSSVDQTLKVGKKAFLLGFFSVNLRKALAASDDAHSAAGAKTVRGAVEFFIFGPATSGAVVTCN